MQLKSHISKDRNDLEQFRGRLLQKDILANEILINPLLAKIKTMTTSKAILNKILKVHLNHDIPFLITDLMLATKPKILREELYNLVVDTYHSAEADLRLFNL